MALRLTLSGGAAGRSSRMLSTGTLSIGRGERNDWVLPDPDRHLSKTHCVLSLENGRCVLTDLSTNGVSINGARTPTVRDSRTELTDGDEFRIGDYTIAVADVAFSGSADISAPGGRDDPLDVDPLDDPLGRAPDPAFSHPIHHAPAPQRLDDPFDLREAASGEAGRQGGTRADPNADLFAGSKPEREWRGPSQADHADAPRLAVQMPRVVAAPASGPDIDFDALIGDLSALQPRPPATMRTSEPTPVRDPFEGFDALPPVAPPASSPVMPPPAATPPVATPPAVASPAVASPAAAPPAVASPVALRQAVAAPAADAGQGLRAFLEGAGVPDTAMTGDPEASMRAIGQVFRALTEGLREVLMSRAALKGELRVEQTLLRSSNNNALKFSFSPEDAVVALLSAGRPGYMPPLAAAREAFDDIKSHEIAVVAGMQTALTSLLDRFDPDTLEARLAQGMLSSVLPAARKSRLWDSFRELHKTIKSEAEDDFQAVFGRNFAKAYTAQAKKD